MQLPLAEKLPYWKSSRTAPDVWIEKTVAVLKKLGCDNINHAFTSVGDLATFTIVFTHGEARYRIVWPVLPTKVGTLLNTKTQAATMLYHDCKAKAVAAAVLGVHGAFVGQLVLPNNETVQEAAVNTLITHRKTIGYIGG